MFQFYRYLHAKHAIHRFDTKTQKAQIKGGGGGKQKNTVSNLSDLQG